MGILKNLLVTGAARFVNTIKGSITHAQNGMYYGTCSTAAGTAAKVVTLVDGTGFELKPGVMIAVKFTVSNTASSCTLNVEGTGAKQVWYNNAVYTSTSTDIFGYANRVNHYVYDGTYWVWTGHGADNNSNTVPAAQCETAAATAAKAATCSNYTLTSNTYLHFIIVYANTVQGAITMNVNSKGAKPIYINGAASSASNYTLPAGSYIAFYNGTYWDFRTNSTFTHSRNHIGKGSIGWTSQEDSTQLITQNDIAYWDGRYNDTSSNLQYTAVGELKDAATHAVETTLANDSNLPTGAAVTSAIALNKTYATHLTGASASSSITIANTTNYQSFMVQCTTRSFSLVGLMNGNTPEIADVYGTHDFTITITNNRSFTIKVGAAGRQYDIFSAEAFTVTATS